MKRIALAIWLVCSCASGRYRGADVYDDGYRHYYVYPRQDLTPGAPIAQPYNVNCYGEVCF